MTQVSLKTFLLLIAVIFLTTCADIETDPVLESIKVIPETHTATLNSEPRQFYAVGYYDDDSTDDLTEQATWTDDSTGGGLLSTAFKGLVYFRKVGWFAVVATFNDVTADTEYTAKSTIQITE